MQKQQQIIEELQKMESFAEMLLEKCYSVRELLSLGGIHPRASIKKRSQSKINQVIANRNRNLKKAKSLLIAFLILSGGSTAQKFIPPSYNSLCSCLDLYYENLSASHIEEFQSTNKNRWLNYLPSPGYSPFTGGFTISLNLTAPIQETRFRYQAKRKIQSILKTNELQAQVLKNQAKADLEALQNSIEEFTSMDTLEYLKEKAFNLVSTQYERNEITPSEFLARQVDYINFKISRLAHTNMIRQKILDLLIKFKCPVP